MFDNTQVTTFFVCSSCRFHFIAVVDELAQFLFTTTTNKLYKLHSVRIETTQHTNGNYKILNTYTNEGFSQPINLITIAKFNNRRLGQIKMLLTRPYLAPTTHVELFTQMPYIYLIIEITSINVQL